MDIKSYGELDRVISGFYSLLRIPVRISMYILQSSNLDSLICLETRATADKTHQTSLNGSRAVEFLLPYLQYRAHIISTLCPKSCEGQVSPAHIRLMYVCMPSKYIQHCCLVSRFEAAHWKPCPGPRFCTCAQFNRLLSVPAKKHGIKSSVRGQAPRIERGCRGVAYNG